MGKRKISATELVRDVRAGLDDSALISKYQLTATRLLAILQKLVESGLLTQAELDSRVPVFERTVEIIFKLPDCGPVESAGPEIAGLNSPQRKPAAELAGPLINAAKAGRIDRVTRLLQQGADVNSRGQWGMTPLIWAASKGHTKVVSLLLDRGADINAEANNRSTALMWTSFTGYVEVVKLLLERGAAVNKVSSCGRTAMASACFSGHIEVVKLLLAHGADINVRDREGKTALSLALEKRHYDIAELLVKHGAQK